MIVRKMVFRKKMIVKNFVLARKMTVLTKQLLTNMIKYDHFLKKRKKKRKKKALAKLDKVSFS
jgi:ABC-type histidine transport system ATPase subunit